MWKNDSIKGNIEDYFIEEYSKQEILHIHTVELSYEHSKAKLDSGNLDHESIYWGLFLFISFFLNKSAGGTCSRKQTNSNRNQF